MRKSVGKKLNIFFALILLLAVVYSCCACAFQINAAGETREPTKEDEVELIVVSDKYGEYETYDKWLDSKLSDNLVTRAEWLCILFDALDIEVRYDLSEKYSGFIDIDDSDNNDVIMTAIEYGYVSGKSKNFGADTPATRQYVANTLINAGGYNTDFTLECEDADTVRDKNQVAAALHYGFMNLDSYGYFNTYYEIAPDEVRNILSELNTRKEWENKKILSFGDSIMHGDGNKRIPLSQLIADKYMMSVSDYSIGGATFGYYEYSEQICNQILAAIQNREMADVILINGGTNDMRWVNAGEISEDFDYGICGRETFASGMEYALWLLKTHYPDVPVVYVRAHDMVCTYETNEFYYGSMALKICEKWDVSVADVFSETDFDCHDSQIRLQYTAKLHNHYEGDSIHPNYEGYKKFYIPLIVEKMKSVL